MVLMSERSKKDEKFHTKYRSNPRDGGCEYIYMAVCIIVVIKFFVGKTNALLRWWRILIGHFSVCFSQDTLILQTE